VGISSKHTLALINRSAATAREIIGFARQIRLRVHDLFGIVLVPEPVMVGVSFDEGTQPGDADQECDGKR
jgi:UDP-N-acetylmuramate dehydrogenase